MSAFPHSDIRGSMSICDSPRLFAAYHVLLRRLMPQASSIRSLQLKSRLLSYLQDKSSLCVYVCFSAHTLDGLSDFIFLRLSYLLLFKIICFTLCSCQCSLARTFRPSRISPRGISRAFGLNYACYSTTRRLFTGRKKRLTFIFRIHARSRTQLILSAFPPIPMRTHAPPRLCFFYDSRYARGIYPYKYLVHITSSVSLTARLIYHIHWGLSSVFCQKIIFFKTFL